MKITLKKKIVQKLKKEIHMERKIIKTFYETHKKWKSSGNHMKKENCIKIVKGNYTEKNNTKIVCKN